MSTREESGFGGAFQNGLDCIALSPKGGLSSEVKVVGWKHKLPHDPEYIFAYTKRPVYAADGTKGFVAVVLQKVKVSQFHGRVYRVPLRVILYPKSWQASCAALLWYCQRLGLAEPSTDPGSLTVARRRELQKSLDKRDRRSAVPVWLPVYAEKPKPSAGADAVAEDPRRDVSADAEILATPASDPVSKAPVTFVGRIRRSLQTLVGRYL